PVSGNTSRSANCGVRRLVGALVARGARLHWEYFSMKTSVFVGTSLDGFIARLNGDLDFLPPGGGEPHGDYEFMTTSHSVFIGRKAYETVLAFNTRPYDDKPFFVLSTHPVATAPLGAMVEHLSGDPAEIVSTLEARGIRHTYVDGGITIQRFLAAGLIQRL